MFTKIKQIPIALDIKRSLAIGIGNWVSHLLLETSHSEVLVPKSYLIDLASHTVYKWSTIDTIRIIESIRFLILKKITSFLVRNLHFFIA